MPEPEQGSLSQREATQPQDGELLLLPHRLAGSAEALCRALELSAAAADRLREAVRTSGQTPAVAASLLGLGSDERIAASVAELYAAPVWSETLKEPTPSPFFNAGFLNAKHALVLAHEAGRLTIGLVDPGDEDARTALAFAAPDPIEFRTITLSYWRELKGNTAGVVESAVGQSGAKAIDVDRLADYARDAPVVRLVDQLLQNAMKAGASDLHLEQKSDAARVRFRVDGELRDVQSLPAHLGAGAVARVKVIAELDVASRRRPQDGRTTVMIGGEPVDVRVSTTPTVHGESLVVRLLQRQRTRFDLAGLGFSEHIVQGLRSMLQRPHGLILLTGPTGSGKTTTLYAALRLVATRGRKVLTVEDPIEYVFEDVNQTQVNEAAGVTFASSLRAFLRHDPDVILVGEIRDTETARLSVQAALTGHLVLATLHTNDAASAPARLIDMGVESYLLAGVLVGVMAQRLAPRLCDGCAVPGTDPFVGADVLHGNSPGVRTKSGQGCARCGGSGYFGRVPIAELLRVTDELERAVALGRPTAELRTLLERGEFRPLHEEALARVRAGDLDLNQAARFSVQ